MVEMVNMQALRRHCTTILTPIPVALQGEQSSPFPLT
jgi:hypothetical protein